MKRRYIIIGNYEQDVEYMYDGFRRNEETGLLFLTNTFIRRNILRSIRHLKINKFFFVQKYFESVLGREIKKKISDTKDEYVFIILARVYETYGRNIIDYLRKYYENCIIVFYLLDMTYRMRFSLEDVRNGADILCSFDEKEAVKYKMQFLREPFDYTKLSCLPETTNIIYDVTFVGSAKGERLKRIYKLYEVLSANNLRCDFHISGVPEKERKFKGQIHYGKLSFDQLLLHAKQSACILELVQDEEYSATSRYSEAMLLRKNLLTDCREFAEGKMMEPNIFYFCTPENIPFLEITKQHTASLQKYIDFFSNEKMIESLDIIIEKYKCGNVQEEKQ